MSSDPDVTVRSWRKEFVRRASALSTGLSVAGLVGIMSVPGLVVVQVKTARTAAPSTLRAVAHARLRDKAGQDKARQDKPGQDKPGQDETGLAAAPAPAPAAPEKMLTPEQGARFGGSADQPLVPPTLHAAPAPTARPPGTVAEPPPDAWPPGDVAAAAHECERLLAGFAADVEHLPPLKSGLCGTPAPISLRSLGVPTVEIRPPVLTNCGMAGALNLWLEKSVQPAARELLGSPVKQLMGASSYACRNRNGSAAGPISEHAFANAVDIAGFVLEDGRTMTVLSGWGAVLRDARPGVPVVGVPVPGVPVPNATVADAAKNNGAVHLGKGPGPSQAPGRKGTKTSHTNDRAPPPATDAATIQFLHRIHKEACGTFGTVLGPEANDFHRDHFHLDLKQRKRHAYCE